jgi:hypothetical protein
MSCCQAHLSTIQNECSSNPSCSYKTACCSLDSGSTCCTGNVCDKIGCSLTEATTCCESNKSSACCQAQLSTIQSECSSNDSCTYKSTCCSLNSESSCCKGASAYICLSTECTVIEAAACCRKSPGYPCCAVRSDELVTGCMSDSACPYKDYCCYEVPTFACCTG